MMVVVLYPVFLIQKLNDVGGQGQSVSPDCPLVVVVTGRLTELLLSISGPGAVLLPPIRAGGNCLTSK